MTGCLGPESVLAAGYPPTNTGTPINIASVIIIAIINASRDLYLPTDCRGHSVFGPRLSG